MRFLYLHGLGSNGQSSTARGLARLGLTVISPDYQPQHYQQSMETLCALVEKQQPELIAGTSMGGYYALKLRERFALPTVIVNPCFDPASLLHKYLETPAHDYITDTQIFFTKQMLAEFEQVKDTQSQPSQFSILIGRNDDVIPAAQQRRFCQQQNWQWQEADWGHRVEDTALLAELMLQTLN